MLLPTLPRTIILLGVLCVSTRTDAFSALGFSNLAPRTRRHKTSYPFDLPPPSNLKAPCFSIVSRISDRMSNKISSTRLQMYNLPPSGGGGGNGAGDIVKGVFAIVLVVAFFASPLGVLVLGLFNSFLVLLFVLPLIASVGFNIWQNLVTIKSTCPSCGAPVIVLKRNKDTDIANPTLCFNCGAVLQANYDNSGVENISGKTGIDDLSTAPLSTNSIFDMFTTERVTTTTATATKKDDTRRKLRRETTVIDVEAEDEDDLPFQ